MRPVKAGVQAWKGEGVMRLMRYANENNRRAGDADGFCSQSSYSVCVGKVAYSLFRLQLYDFLGLCLCFWEKVYHEKTAFQGDFPSYLPSQTTQRMDTLAPRRRPHRLGAPLSYRDFFAVLRWVLRILSVPRQSDSHVLSPGRASVGSSG